jgi:hypothetical protein
MKNKSNFFIFFALAVFKVMKYLIKKERLLALDYGKNFSYNADIYQEIKI